MLEKGEKETSNSIAIPIGIEFQRWMFMVRGLKQLGADSKTISYEELSKLTKIPATLISGNLKFLHKIEFITPESAGASIKLSTEGNDFANALMMKDEVKQKELLLSSLTKNLTDITSFYNLHQQNEDLDFEMLFNHIKLISKAPDVNNTSGNTYPAYRTGIYTLIKMLIFTELIDKKYDPELNSLSSLKDKSSQPRTKAEVPLHCSIEWMKRLFSTIRNMNPSTIPRAFITANVTAHHHEGSVLVVARFLELIDKDGNRAKNYEKLRHYGNEGFSKNLSEIIEEKYSKIFSLADIKTVEQKNLEMVFMNEYNLGSNQAHSAIGVLTSLCQLANIPISESLLVKKKPSTEKSIKPKNLLEKSKNSNRNVQGNNSPPPPTIPYQIPESPFKINLNFNVEIKDKESMESAIDLIRNLKRELRTSLPELNIKVNEEPSD